MASLLPQSTEALAKMIDEIVTPNGLRFVLIVYPEGSAGNPDVTTVLTHPKDQPSLSAVLRAAMQSVDFAAIKRSINPFLRT